MALKAKKPKEISQNKRCKLMLFGEAGVGKSTAATMFPNNYFIDAERGVEHDGYIKRLEKAGSVVFQTSDMNEIFQEVHELRTTTHNFRTITIDPFTPIYNDLLEQTEAAMTAAGEDMGFGRHYARAGKVCKQLLNILLNKLDMNVIVTCHAKILYGDNMTKLGMTFDGYKKLDYIFDLVLYLERRGDKRVATVKKTRIDSFKDGETFEWSYEEFVRRYGADVSKQSTPVNLATDEQVKELYVLVDRTKLKSGTVERWLVKADANRFEEMTADVIQKCIDFCKKGDVTK